MAGEKCCKCSGVLVAGYIPDHSHAAVLLASWVGGQPEKSFWYDHTLKGSEVHPLQAFRCFRLQLH